MFLKILDQGIQQIEEYVKFLYQSSEYSGQLERKFIICKSDYF